MNVDETKDGPCSLFFARLFLIGSAIIIALISQDAEKDGCIFAAWIFGLLSFVVAMMAAAICAADELDK